MKFSHLGLLVPSVEKTAAIFHQKKLPVNAAKVFESEGTKEIYIGSYQNNAGLLLLMEPFGKGPYLTAMEKRGPGIHHFAIDVLNFDHFLNEISGSGWNIHPISATTRKNSNTIWLHHSGLPLIEVQECKTLSTRDSLIQKITLHLKNDLLPLFSAIGLGEIVTSDENSSTLILGNHTFNLLDLIE